ncbi:hypothetical protein DFQ27_008779, partial [Actinomortierella ambigua]
MKSRLVLLLLVSLTVVALAVGEQTPVAPAAVYQPASAKYKNKFYLYGGRGDPSAMGTGQFFSLDLSKNWTSESPAWQRLHTGPIREFGSGAISHDGKIFIAFPDNQLLTHRYIFDNETGSWSASKATFDGGMVRRIGESNSDIAMKGVIPVTLGTDGTVLIAGGDPRNGSTNQATYYSLYAIYSFESDQSVTRQLPPKGLNSVFMAGRVDYGAGWSEYLKKAVFFGGWAEGSVSEFVLPWEPNHIVTYDPKTGEWKEE